MKKWIILGLFVLSTSAAFALSAGVCGPDCDQSRARAASADVNVLGVDSGAYVGTDRVSAGVGPLGIKVGA